MKNIFTILVKVVPYNVHSIGMKGSELKGSSSRKLKGIPANFGKPQVLTVAKERGKGDFTTVREALIAVPVNNKSPVEITVKQTQAYLEVSFIRENSSKYINLSEN